MTNNITELVFILDRSGSMAGLESDTIGGFNAMLAKQKAQAGEAFVTTVLFDQDAVTLHDRMKIADVPEMTARDYCVRGTTALLDTVGMTVEHIAAVHRYIRPEDVPQKTMVIITTDGMENASREYSYERVRGLIDERQKAGWEFIFLGANIDAIREAARFGISARNAVTYKADHRGTALNFDVISETVAHVRAGAPMAKDWKLRIEKDVEKRGR